MKPNRQQTCYPQECLTQQGEAPLQGLGAPVHLEHLRPLLFCEKKLIYGDHLPCVLPLGSWKLLVSLSGPWAEHLPEGQACYGAVTLAGGTVLAPEAEFQWQQGCVVQAEQRLREVTQLGAPAVLGCCLDHHWNQSHVASLKFF